MAQGQVNVYNRNLGQGDAPSIERVFLYVGYGQLNQGTPVAVNAETDLGDVISAGELLDNMQAAQLNGKQNWNAYVLSIDEGDDLHQAVFDAQEVVSTEAVIVIPAHNTAAVIEDWQETITTIGSKYGRYIFAAVATGGIDADSQTWADYLAEKSPLIADVAADRLGVIPQLHGNNIGVLAGRLADKSASIADSPMRVRTGALLGLGTTPADVEGRVLDSSTLYALDAARYSVPQCYADYPGMYWGDMNILDVPTGDYKVIEYLRPVLAVMRDVRLRAIYRIADRLFNSTVASIEAHKTYFSKPLRDRSKTTAFMGYVFPGDIKPPTADAITINWISKTEVHIYIKVCPYNSPKLIEANVILDLSTEVA